VLAGKPVAVETTKVFGCSVKWADKRGSVKDGFREVGARAGGARADRRARHTGAGEERGRQEAALINVWATWCGPCVIEFPDLVSLHRIYRGREFEVVTVNADDPDKKEKALEFLKTQQASTKNYAFDKGDPYALIEAVDAKWQGAAAAPRSWSLRRRGDLPQRGRLRHARATARDRGLAGALLTNSVPGEKSAQASAASRRLRRASRYAASSVEDVRSRGDIYNPLK
jgi:thiol-disulfide isomerase/thioredoxin